MAYSVTETESLYHTILASLSGFSVLKLPSLRAIQLSNESIGIETEVGAGSNFGSVGTGPSMNVTESAMMRIRAK